MKRLHACSELTVIRNYRMTERLCSMDLLRSYCRTSIEALENNNSPEIVWIKNVNGEITKFNVCEKYSLWVTMDLSFEKDDYKVSWSINCKVISTDTIVCFEMTEEMVGEKVA